jgi:probable rRNA maturation factor
MLFALHGPPEFRRASAPLRAIVRAVLAAEARTAGDVTIVLTNDDTVRRLNRQWRGIDRATDVLSFDYDGTPTGRRGRRVDGDLVISIDRVRDQARRYQVTRGEELARLVVHGILHLAGRDHQKPAERQVMRAQENSVLRRCRRHARVLDRVLA